MPFAACPIFELFVEGPERTFTATLQFITLPLVTITGSGVAVGVSVGVSVGASLLPPGVGSAVLSGVISGVAVGSSEGVGVSSISGLSGFIYAA